MYTSYDVLLRKELSFGVRVIAHALKFLVALTFRPHRPYYIRRCGLLLGPTDRVTWSVGLSVGLSH